MVEDQLAGTLTSELRYSAAELRARAWAIVGPLLDLDDAEEDYVRTVNEKGILRLDLLFATDSRLADRLAGHPALLWKIHNVRRYRGGITVGFTGQAVTHPDGRQLQRIGLIPDLEVTPTVDEVERSFTLGSDPGEVVLRLVETGAFRHRSVARGIDHLARARALRPGARPPESKMGFALPGPLTGRFVVRAEVPGAGPPAEQEVEVAAGFCRGVDLVVPGPTVAQPVPSPPAASTGR